MPRNTLYLKQTEKVLTQVDSQPLSDDATLTFSNGETVEITSSDITSDNVELNFDFSSGHPNILYILYHNGNNLYCAQQFQGWFGDCSIFAEQVECIRIYDMSDCYEWNGDKSGYKPGVDIDTDWPNPPTPYGYGNGDDENKVEQYCDILGEIYVENGNWVLYEVEMIDKAVPYNLYLKTNLTATPYNLYLEVPYVAPSIPVLTGGTVDLGDGRTIVINSKMELCDTDYTKDEVYGAQFTFNGVSGNDTIAVGYAYHYRNSSPYMTLMESGTHSTMDGKPQSSFFDLNENDFYHEGTQVRLYLCDASADYYAIFDNFYDEQYAINAVASGEVEYIGCFTIEGDNWVFYKNINYIMQSLTLSNGETLEISNNYIMCSYNEFGVIFNRSSGKSSVAYYYDRYDNLINETAYNWFGIPGTLPQDGDYIHIYDCGDDDYGILSTGDYANESAVAEELPLLATISYSSGDWVLN